MVILRPIAPRSLYKHERDYSEDSPNARWLTLHHYDPDREPKSPQILVLVCLPNPPKKVVTPQKLIVFLVLVTNQRLFIKTMTTIALCSVTSKIGVTCDTSKHKYLPRPQCPVGLPRLAMSLASLPPRLQRTSIRNEADTRELLTLPVNPHSKQLHCRKLADSNP